MYHFQLENPYTGEKAMMSVPEDMTIEDFTREIRCDIGLQYTVGTRFHFIIDKEQRVFMQDDAISAHVDMLWEGGDDENDPDKKAPKYHEEYYHPESKYTLHDLFPEIGSEILYTQDSDRIYCKLVKITGGEEE